MADGVKITVDATKLLSMMARVGPSIDFHTRDVARETAMRVVAEAKRRIKRVTGATAEGIHLDMTYDRKGYIVIGYDKETAAEADRNRSKGGTQTKRRRQTRHFPDLYLEYGTKYQRAQPFFFSSATLEEDNHRRRMSERVQTVLDDLGR